MLARARRGHVIFTALRLPRGGCPVRWADAGAPADGPGPAQRPAPVEQQKNSTTDHFMCVSTLLANKQPLACMCRACVRDIDPSVRPSGSVRPRPVGPPLHSDFRFMACSMVQIVCVYICVSTLATNKHARPR